MPTWVAVVLIFVSLGALLMAVWCRLFMAPLKDFWERVNTLGGGIEGIEAHVGEVREEIQGRLARLETSSQEEIGKARETVQGALERLSRDVREAQRESEKLRKDLQSLQAEIRDTRSDTQKVGQTAERELNHSI